MRKIARQFLNDTFPLNRVMSSADADTFMRALVEFAPVNVHAFRSGEQQGGWQVPKGWEVVSGTIHDSRGRLILDATTSPLSIWSNSDSFTGEISLEELRLHILTNPDQPQHTPFHFRRQYRPWDIGWGVCLPDEVAIKLAPGNYFVDISTRSYEHEMKVADWTLPGESKNTILIIAHWDHPAQVNDGLAGCVAGIELMHTLQNLQRRKFTYTLLLTTEIIGTIHYIARFPEQIANVQEAIVFDMPGTSSPLRLQHSLKGDSRLDRIFSSLISSSVERIIERNFLEGIGNDETVLEAPGIEIPTVSLSRFPYDQYHTSADNMDNFNEERFDDFLQLAHSAINILESAEYPQRSFDGLPCLSHPDLNLYLAPNESIEFDSHIFMYKVWHLLDGKHSAFDISNSLSVPIDFVIEYLAKAKAKGLIES